MNDVLRRSSQFGNIIQLNGTAAAITFCLLAGICATLLSGIEFPAHINVWHLPIVLDFAGSPEGPHDAYNRSFSSYVSAFWLPFRLIADEGNVEAVFIGLQLLENALLLVTLFLFFRFTSGRTAPSALVSAGFCFCYGLWGRTILGYSEQLATYASHSQFAIILCLLGLLALINDKPLWSAVSFGLAADSNLFMGAWGVLAAELYLLTVEKRIFSRSQIILSVVFGLLTAPVAIWALSKGTSSSSIPLQFFRSFLAGHVYALDYPQAALLIFSLGLAAGFAALSAAPNMPKLRYLGIAMLCCTASLSAGAAMPYMTDKTLLLLLHPLRFSSVIVFLAIACAGALLVLRLSSREATELLPPFIAAVGFSLRIPLVTIFGFSLVLSAASPKYQRLGLALSLVAMLSLLFTSYVVDASLKHAVAYFLMCALVATATWRCDLSKSRLDCQLWLLSTGLLGSIAVVSPSQLTMCVAAMTVPSVVFSLTKVPSTWKQTSLLLNAVAVLLLLFSVRGEPGRALLIAGGLVLISTASYWPRPSSDRFSAFIFDAALVAPILLLMAAGMVREAIAHFGVARSPELKDFRAAEFWARANTPIDTMFFTMTPRGVEFSMFSRRPVWWGHDQGAAVLWMPSYYKTWTCRTNAITVAERTGQMDALLNHANVDYVIVERPSDWPLPRSFVPVFQNSHYSVLERSVPKVNAPLCPD